MGNKSMRIALTMIITLALNLLAQNNNRQAVSGFVYDNNNGEALIGATVTIAGTKLGATTNNSGYFMINDIPVGKQKLVVTYLGYKISVTEVTIPPKNTSQLKIYLVSESVKMNEVVVTSDKSSLADKLFDTPVSKLDLSGSQINAIPKVIEADLLRALQTMPGIASVSDFSSALYIRGGTPDQNLFLIDGTDVYNPDHAFGIFSTFNTNAIKKVEVSKGGFSSEYGGRLSSVIDVTNLDGNRNNFEGVVNVSLLSGATTLQIPVGTIGSISGSFRRTYLDATYAKWSKDIPAYYFYDANLKGFFELSENDKLSISYFNSRDNLNYKLDKNKPESAGFDYTWGNKTASVNWKHIFNQDIFASFWVTGSGFDSDFGFDKLFELTEKNTLQDYAFKASLEYYPSSELSAKFGAEQKNLKFVFKEGFQGGKVDIENKASLTSAYIDFKWKPTVLWDINFGLRSTYYNADKNHLNIEPRFAAKYRVSEIGTLKFAAGMYHQYLNRIPRMFLASIWTAVDKNTKPSLSNHYILSYEHQLTDIIQLQVEAYYKTYKDIYQFNQNLNVTLKPGYYNNEGLPVYNSTEGILTRGDGNSRGLEILFRKEAGTINGWFSYTYSHTNHTFDGINKGKAYSPRHDRASVINFVVNGDLDEIFSWEFDRPAEPKSSKWLFGINFVYASGQPITVPSSAYFAGTIPDEGDVNPGGESLPGYKMYPQTINSYRLPAYARMDLSITYEKNYDGWTLAPYLQIFNFGSRKNIWFVSYKNEVNGNTVVQKTEKVYMLPFLPSIGVNIKF